MKSSGQQLFPVCVGLLLWLAAARPLPAAPAAAPVAELVGLTGQGEVRKKGETVFSPAVLLQKLFAEEAFRTLARSKAMLLFQEQTVLVLGPATTIEIADFLIDPAGPGWQRWLRLLEGRLRFLVSRFLGQDPEMTLETPLLTVAVRGTDGVIISQPGEDRVYLFAAVRPLMLKHKLTGEVVELPAGFWALARKVGPLLLQPLTPTQQQELEQELNLLVEIRPPRPESGADDSRQGGIQPPQSPVDKPGVVPQYQPVLPQPPAPSPGGPLTPSSR